MLWGRAVTTQAAVTLAAAEAAIAAGTILHVRADRLPARRHPRRDPMPAVDLTVGPDARGGFLVVDYARVPCGEEVRHELAADAVRAARRLLGWERLAALRAALVRVHGEADRASSVAEEERLAETGARMRAAYEHRGGIVGPLFGPSGEGR